MSLLNMFKIEMPPEPEWPDIPAIVKQRGNDAKAEALKKLSYLQHDGDPEATHSLADDALCDLLVSIGYEDVVEAWKKVPKWYA